VPKPVVHALALAVLISGTANGEQRSDYIEWLNRTTADAVVFEDDGAKAVVQSLFLDCSLLGLDGRYIMIETLLRRALLEFGGDAVKSGRVYDHVYKTVAGVFADTVILKDPRGREEAARQHTLVVDNAGHITVFKLQRPALRNACAGGLGPIVLSEPEVKAVLPASR
jgi:hypothetical protein